MISRRSRTTSAAAALFAAVALGVPAAAQATTPADSGNSATAAVPVVTATPAPVASVVLPTGDRVTVGTGANPSVTMDQTPGASDTFATANVGGDRYVIPAEAAPYLGHGLDLSLFDVTKLAAAAPDPSAHIPVQLTFAAGVTPAAPAGVTFTSVSGQSATGYLTPDSGKAFAQALRDAIKADLAAGHQAGTTPVFGGLTSMTALGATTPAATTVQPYYPLHILQINTLDDTGAPSNVLMLLVNTDSFRTFSALVPAQQGVARVAVPAGNYAALSFDFTFDAQAGTSNNILVAKDGITVPATGAVPPATIDDRTATSPVSFTTQKPSTEGAASLTVGRHDANGVGEGLGLIYGGGAPVPPTFYVSPAAKATTGTLDYAVDWTATGPATAASPYRYDLGVISDQISANQSYAPADSSLATLKHSFDLDPAFGTKTPSFGGTFLNPDGTRDAVRLPMSSDSLTDYVTGGLSWFNSMTLPAVAGPDSTATTIFEDDPVRYQAGQTGSRTWTHAPLAPSFGQHPAATHSLYNGCQACVGAGSMDLSLGMLGDSNKDTTGEDVGASGTAQLYWNGTLVSSGTDRFGFYLQNLAAGPATVRTVFDYDLSATGRTQSTKIHTDVTIPYSGQDEPGMTLPSGTECLPALEAGTPDAPCQILPALTLNYQLKALTNTNTSHSPDQDLVLNVGHLSYGSAGSTARITSAQVSVSYDNGATWQDAPTHGGNGIYAAHWANPKAGSPVELKVTATDCLGGSITQTVTNPYTVG